MEIGVVKIAEDEDFQKLKDLTRDTKEWKLEYEKGYTSVSTQINNASSFKLIKVKSCFKDVSPSLLYDVILDTAYRKKWDSSMLESFDIGCLNANNDIGYYALRCPPPLTNRDFLLQRSWLQIGNEYMMLNHSICHDEYPPKKECVRAISYITGFLITSFGDNGCHFYYVSQCDPRGVLPSWVVNKVIHWMAPTLIKKLHKGCTEYLAWKKRHNPNFKPWLNPEQLSMSRIDLLKCSKNNANLFHEIIDESSTLDCKTFLSVGQNGNEPSDSESDASRS